MGLFVWYATVWGLLLLLLGIVPFYQVYRLLLSEWHGHLCLDLDHSFQGIHVRLFGLQHQFRPSERERESIKSNFNERCEQILQGDDDAVQLFF
mgnify:CR=1 FL=1